MHFERRLLVAVEGVFVGGEVVAAARERHFEVGRQVGVEEPCPLQFLQARKIAEFIEAEVAEERIRSCRRSPAGPACGGGRAF